MESIESTSLENFCYLPAGPVPPNPSELLLSDLFEKLLEDLQKEFDMVILDTPPVGLVTDGLLVMKKADLQIYVVRSGYSKRSYLKTLENLKMTDQFNKLTIVFNSMEGSNSYGYGYGSGAGHGYYDEDYKKNGFAASLKSFF
ncbi:MAG: CpsD/CapB family tyrosine-protein kinase [Cytophagales bacterium]|nr:CpsD/CapB family tyrosine-protein kinase [Cytophagales bacterium]